MIKKFLSGLILATVFLAPCFSFADGSNELIVSAAISLKNAFEEIGKAYEAKNHGMKVLFNFGASGDLMRQIEGGAPVDVFASAAQKDMDDAEKKGLVLAGSRKNFAANSVVLVVPAKTKMTVDSFGDLNSARIKKIAVGNPMTVPAGRYAADVFNYYKITAAVRDKLILTENIRQALDYVARGEVDAGVVYSTDAMARAKEVSVAAVAPDESHKPVIYPVAAVKETKKRQAAEGFIAFLNSHEGKGILKKYGFRAAK